MGNASGVLGLHSPDKEVIDLAFEEEMDFLPTCDLFPFLTAVGARDAD
jgi:hypothetical protein